MTTPAQSSATATSIRTPSLSSGTQPGKKPEANGGLQRRTLGIILLLIVVFLWTTSNFLASVCRMCLLPFYALYSFQLSLSFHLVCHGVMLRCVGSVTDIKICCSRRYWRTKLSRSRSLSRTSTPLFSTYHLRSSSRVERITCGRLGS